MARSRVFVDTNVLFEAFRVGAWNRFGGAYSVETVDKCVEESQTGDRSACGRIDVPLQQLRDGLTGIHVPSKKDRASCLLQCRRLPYCACNVGSVAMSSTASAAPFRTRGARRLADTLSAVASEEPGANGVAEYAREEVTGQHHLQDRQRRAYQQARAGKRRAVHQRAHSLEDIRRR